MRRASGSVAFNRELRFSGLVFDPDMLDASRDGKKIVLTKTGYVLLRCLMSAAPRIVLREFLEHAIWGDNRPDSDALRKHIHTLRQALDKPFAFPMVHTVPGVGYRLVLPDALG